MVPTKKYPAAASRAAALAAGLAALLAAWVSALVGCAVGPQKASTAPAASRDEASAALAAQLALEEQRASPPSPGEPWRDEGRYARWMATEADRLAGRVSPRHGWVFGGLIGGVAGATGGGLVNGAAAESALYANGGRFESVALPAQEVFGRVVARLQAGTAAAPRTARGRAVTLAGAGAANFSPTSRTPVPATQEAMVDMEAAAAAPLEGLRAAQSEPGYLVTEWVPIRGKEAGLGPLRRQWLAEVRFHIRVTPRYEAPSNACVLLLVPEVRERPNDNYPWTAASAELATQQARDVFKWLLPSAPPTPSPPAAPAGKDPR